jgi:nucleotidyltransferase substrate binding protein (TIGR01987 family)
MTKDIRFVQRFNNFLKAFMQLESAISLTKERKLSDLEKQGLIQAFEYCHELAWNVLKDFLQNEEGKSEIYGSKSATREAFRVGLISNGEVWMEMIKDRNQTVHTYNSETSEQIFNNIVKSYFAEFVSFKNKFKKLKEAAES